MLKLLKKYFSSLLIIDKSLDLLLLVIGLVSAIQFNSYLNNKQKEEVYKNSLTKIHTEISINKIILKNYSNSLINATNIIWDLDKLANKGFLNSYPGILNINDLKVKDLNDKSFKASNREIFLDKNLFTDINMLYKQYYYLENSWDTYNIHIEKSYKAYFNVFASQKLSHLASKEANNIESDFINDFIVSISDFYNNGSHTLKMQYWPEIFINNSIILSDLALNKIEDELESFNISIKDYRSFDDYYWLSYYSLTDEDNTNAIDYAYKGIDVLNEVYSQVDSTDFEFNSFNSRLNRNIVFGINAKINNKDTTYKKQDILPHLKEWYRSGIYLEACIVEYLDYYYNNNDFENFLKYTKYIFELESQDYYIKYISSWPDFMIKDPIISILNTTNTSINIWNSRIFPKKI